MSLLPMSALVPLLLAVTLSPPFGAASARLIGFSPDTVTIEVTVELLEPAALVLMRGEDVSGQELEPVALLQRDDGSWGAVVELPARPDLRLAFELIPERGASTLSAAAGLVDLGIDRDRLTALSRPEPRTDEPISRPGLVWGVIGALAGVAALALVAVWSRGGGRRETPDVD